MKILLAFIGVHDPFGETSTAGEREPGPVLTVTATDAFDRVCLFSLPDRTEVSAQTREALQKRNPGLTVEICEVSLKIPADRLEITKYLKACFRRIHKQHPRAEYFVCVSSGSSQMDAAWLMLAAGGEIPARILQTRPGKFFRPGEGRVMEMDFTHPHLPQIKPFRAAPAADGPYDFQSLSDELCLVGDHGLFLRELMTAFAMAENDSPVLLLGETGTGKEAFARLIHCASKRSTRPFVAVNCAALPGNLLESRLFGHAQGAFPGADRDTEGSFEAANGGTLFLDQLDALPAACQARLMRAMEQGKIRRVGDDQELRVNVRVMAATNVDIKDVVADKTRKLLYQSFYLLHFSPQAKKKWDRMLKGQAPAPPEEPTIVQTDPVPLPDAVAG